MAAPIRKGEEVEVRIDSLAYGGNGVGRLDGFVVFVRGGLPGDLVRARATKVKRGFAEAMKVELLEPGPNRVEAPCRHFGVCGGCRFQDLAYEAQAAAKETQVREALTRLGGFEQPPVEPIVPARSIFAYRNKLEYSFAGGDDGLVLGFHRAGRWDEVIDVEECLLTTDVGNAIREAVKRWARDEGLEPYDQDTHTGYLRHLVVREGRNTGQVLVMLVTAPGRAVRRRLPDRDGDAVSRGALAALGDQRPPGRGDESPDPAALGRAVDRGGAPRPALPRPPERLPADEHRDGGDAVHARARRGRAHGQRGRLRPLLRHRHDRACAGRRRGFGLGRRDLRGVGRVRDRERGGRTASATRSSSPGTSASRIEELREKAGPPGVVVVDPPRAGLAGKALRRTGALEAPRIVYVSCNPTTLASDLAVLRDEYGYRLERCTPVDMFPHTPHIESVSLLTHTGVRADRDDGDAHGGTTTEAVRT